MPIVISALGADRPGIVDELSRVILDQNCNIEDSRMSVLGGVFAVILLVNGEPGEIDGLSPALQQLSEQQDLTITTREAGERSGTERLLPYEVTVVSLDHPGIVNNLSHFFSTRGINIQKLDTATYSAAHTATPMFSVRMTLEIPAGQSLNDLREAFYDLCDEYNLDGIIDAVRPN
jgi:glycine cleavage system transcriptional repressor